MRNALSIDVEDYFQVHNFESVVRRDEWDRYPSRVERNTRLVLRILSETETRATFFILGWVAERFPRLVCEIADAGHEVASHGYGHQLVYRQSRRAFTEDLDRALDAIGQALTGRPKASLQGYRAPSFSVTRDSLWALQVLRERGFSYDSSVFPLLAHDRYGIPGARRFPHRLQSGLWEVPLSTVRVGGHNWPLAGGGYFRLYPYWLIRWGLNRIRAEGHPAVLYFHPWEFDPDQPRIDGLGALMHARHYLGLSRTASCLRRLLNEHQFGPISEVFGLA